MEICTVNRRLLPIKATYFFILAATASLLPYLAIYMVQLGLSPSEMGIIYGTMPFIGALIRPIIGIIADKLHAHKRFLMLCCIVTGVLYACLLFVPSRPKKDPHRHTVQLHCNRNSSFLQFCPTGVSNCERHIHIETYLNPTDCQLSCQWNETDFIFCKNDFIVQAACENFTQLISDRPDNYQPQPIVTQTSCANYTDCDNMCIRCNFDALYFVNRSYIFSCNQKKVVNCFLDCNSTRVPNSEDPGLSSVEISKKYEQTFWLFFLISFVANLAFSPIYSLMDAIVYDFLGEERGKWGKQRCWGTFGFAIFAVASGLIMDIYNGSGRGQNFVFAFVLYGLCNFAAAFTLLFFKASDNLTCGDGFFRNLDVLLKKLEMVTLLALVFIFGMYTGLIETFLYVHLTALGGTQLLCGLCMVFNCLPEIAILFTAGRIIPKLGHLNCLYIAFVAYCIRLICYSFLGNPWLVLLVEPLHGLTFGLMYAAASHYGSLITPDGMHGTVQGLIGGLHFGFGKGCGSVISGQIVQAVGAAWTFRIYGISAPVFLIIFFIIQKFCLKTPRDIKTTDTSDVKVKEDEDVTMLNGSAPIHNDDNGKRSEDDKPETASLVQTPEVIT